MAEFSTSRGMTDSTSSVQVRWRSSGVSAHAVRAIRPPGRRTRSISCSAVVYFVKWAMTKLAITTSNAPSRNGRSIACAAASRRSPFGFEPRAASSIP